MFLVSNSIFIMSKHQTTPTKEKQFIITKENKKKDDNDWNQLITNKTNSKQFALKYIPQKYICKKVYNSKI